MQIRLRIVILKVIICKIVIKISSSEILFVFAVVILLILIVVLLVVLLVILLIVLLVVSVVVHILIKHFYHLTTIIPVFIQLFISPLAGLSSIFPLSENLEPWQGQSQERSDLFHFRAHPRCGQRFWENDKRFTTDSKPLNISCG